jgi:8-oxo-dGTP diphosphatase
MSGLLSTPSVPAARQDERVVVHVVGAAVVREGRVLASRRTGPAHLKGLWEFPGGKGEPGETDEQALVRELSEELGVTAVIGGRVGPELQLSDTAVMRVYLATLVSGEPALTDHDEHRWLGADELYDVPWIPADAPALAALEPQLRGISLPPGSGGAAILDPG